MRRPGLSLWKKVAFTAIVSLLAFAGVDLALRAFFSLRVGPSVFLYGTPWARPEVSKKLNPKGAEHQDRDNVAFHDNAQENYTKYFPHQRRVDTDEHGERFDVRINSHGFRGKEWKVEKEPGVFRIVTLGASSTFGYHDREDETYPHYLEQYLREWLRENPRPGVTSVEVINLGIPHLLAGEILALYLAEARPLKPDAVTFYEGINDAASFMNRPHEQGKKALRSIPLVAPLYRELRARSIAVALFGHLINPAVSSFDRQAVEAHLEGRSERFIGNLARLAEAVREDGAVFVPMTQMTQPELIPRDRIRGVTYEQEVSAVREKLEKEGSIDVSELYFHAHSVLMEDLRKWTRDGGIPLVDVIRVLDPRRDVLLSWVHLTPEGNRMIARALAAEIGRHIAPERDLAAGVP